MAWPTANGHAKSVQKHVSPSGIQQAKQRQARYSVCITVPPRTPDMPHTGTRSDGAGCRGRRNGHRDQTSDLEAAVDKWLGDDAPWLDPKEPSEDPSLRVVVTRFCQSIASPAGRITPI